MSWAFSATSATIVSGAVAERCTTIAYVTCTVVMTAFVYPVVACAVWNPNGFANPGREDHDPLFNIVNTTKFCKQVAF